MPTCTWDGKKLEYLFLPLQNKKHFDYNKKRLEYSRRFFYGIFKYLWVCNDTFHFGFAIT